MHNACIRACHLNSKVTYMSKESVHFRQKLYRQNHTQLRLTPLWSSYLSYLFVGQSTYAAIHLYHQTIKPLSTGCHISMVTVTIVHAQTLN